MVQTAEFKADLVLWKHAFCPLYWFSGYLMFYTVICLYVGWRYPSECLTVNYSISRLITVVTAGIRYTIINANDSLTWSETYDWAWIKETKYDTHCRICHWQYIRRIY